MGIDESFLLDKDKYFVCMWVYECIGDSVEIPSLVCKGQGKTLVFCSCW